MMVNKKGSMSTTLLVIMTFVIVGVALFSFYNNSKEVKTELIDVYFMNKMYSNELKTENELSAKFENKLLSNYPFAIKGGKNEFKQMIVNAFDADLVEYGFRSHTLVYEDGVFYFSGEMAQPITGCLDKDKNWNWGDFTNEDNCELAVIYRPKIDFELDLNAIGLETYEDYSDAVSLCEHQKDVLSCLKKELVNFDSTYDGETGKVSFSSKNLYFINNKLQKIELQEDFTQDL